MGPSWEDPDKGSSQKRPTNGPKGIVNKAGDGQRGDEEGTEREKAGLNPRKSADPGASIGGELLMREKSAARAKGQLEVGSDDDIVMRQIREAANRETDPLLKAKLWEEYQKLRAARP